MLEGKKWDLFLSWLDLYPAEAQEGKFSSLSPAATHIFITIPHSLTDTIVFRNCSRRAVLICGDKKIIIRNLVAQILLKGINFYELQLTLSDA